MTGAFGEDSQARLGREPCWTLKPLYPQVDKEGSSGFPFSTGSRAAASVQGGKPAVHVLLCLILGITISPLEGTFELIAPAVDRREIIVSQFAPLLFDFALNCESARGSDADRSRGHSSGTCKIKTLAHEMD